MLLAGLYVAPSPWILRDVSPTAGMIWSNIVAGALVIIPVVVALHFGRSGQAGTH
jgi:hypothetical protein